MSDQPAPNKRKSARSAHKNGTIAPASKKNKQDNAGSANARENEVTGEDDGTHTTEETKSDDEEEEEGDVVVVKTVQGVDRRALQRLLEEEEEDDDNDNINEVPIDGTNEVPNDTGAERQEEEQGMPKSARDIMGAFMDFDNENTNARASSVREQQNPTVVEGGVTRELMKALSHRAAGHCREKHMTDRVVDYCKTQLFRKVKFITGEEMTTKAVTTVMDALNIVAHERPHFVKLYTTCVTGSINSKRSTCEQAGRKIVRNLLIEKQHKKDNGVPPYYMDSLVKLRRSYKGSAADLEAFVWFFGNFLDCVSGARAWGGQQKYVDEVSKAEIKGVGGRIKLVTVSDEAFGLLLYENYVDKWIQKFHEERRTLLPSMICTGNKKKSDAGRKKNGDGATKIRGKYTKGTVGNCEFGGWSGKGLRRFNELCQTVDQDRQDPKASMMEGYLLKEIRRTKFGNTTPVIESDDDSIDHVLNGAPAIQAYCEL